ncbi:unnamed protein product [Clonostachys rhizophaga]|uniref:Uncharacterized protein n=1 Tax=Clonostachys rhizophaga TaxID=160324 RepID=A0A9N9YS26_9HYPO|nr:unnamed protein product [Clonostachys rhizophaga]
MASITIAVIGAGLIGPRHARTASALEATKLVAIVDPAPPDLVASPDKPEAAIVCTPNHTHVAVAKELSAAGIHVLLDKPVLVGHHRRFNPYIVSAKQVLSSGSLGNIIAISGLWATLKPLDYFDAPTEWRRHKTGGVVLINLIHEVDLLHHLIGPITKVHAEKTMSQRGFEAEEGAALTLRFKSGVVGTFIISDNVCSPYNFESGTGENPLIPKTGQDSYRIFGFKATLSVPDLTLWSYKGEKLSWHSEMESQKTPVIPGIPFELQLDHFSKVIRGAEEPSCTVRTGLAALIVCDAVKKALETNTTIEIDDNEL